MRPSPPPAPGSVALAVNPRAGGGRGAAIGDTARSLLARAGITVQEVPAGDALAAAKAMRDAVSAGARALVVVGGDGMVHLGVNAVAGTPTALGVIPAGTGNDVPRELGLPAQVEPAVSAIAATLRNGRVRHVDAVRCSGGEGSRWFAGVLAAGFDAVVNERANGWADRRGWPRGSAARYTLAVLRELPSFRQRDYVLELDGVRLETSAMIVAVANTPAYGGGMQVAPGARPDDGLLDVLVAGPLGRAEFVRVFPRVFRGRHVDHPGVHLHRAKRVRVAADGIVGYADGERVGPLPLDCEVVPGALRLLGTGSAVSVTS